jgi:DNA-directed RNA polymerase
VNIHTKKEKQKIASETPILLSKLETARQYKNAPELYFPHSVDFRGRAYPISAPFNHQGDDISRSMLRFGTRKPLGERGWFWLRIHCANLFGQDKLTLEKRVEWINDNLDTIVNTIGADPIGHGSVKFLSEHTDDFWQAVAVSLEIRDAVKSGNPLTFESSLPVHQDGSCNGLQHYAALGRDKLGALAVNVIPSDKVEDVYSVVLGIVKERVTEEAEKCPDELKRDMSLLFKACPLLIVATFSPFSFKCAIYSRTKSAVGILSPAHCAQYFNPPSYTLDVYRSSVPLLGNAATCAATERIAAARSKYESHLPSSDS